MDSENIPNVNNEYLSARATELFKSLNYEGWDGYGGYPLSEICYNNVQNIIKYADEDVLNCFSLFPSPNATFSFEIRKTRRFDVNSQSRDINILGAMSVGENGFSYVAWKETADKPKIKISGEEPFDAEKAASILKRMIEFV